MKPEDILHEAEKFNLRDEVFTAVRTLKKQSPTMSLETVYDVAWEKVRKENRIQ